jgi:hypothetical protein
MKKANSLINVFTGAEASVIFLKGELEEIGISPLIKNDFSDAWLGVAPPSVTLYIQESDLSKAEPIIKEFIKNNKS